MEMVARLLGRRLLACAFTTGVLLVPAVGAEPGGHPHAPAAGVKALDVYAAGEAVHLLVAESSGAEAAALFHRRSADGGETWSPPWRVDATLPAAHSPHRGMDPQIAAAGDRLVAVWMTRGTGYFDSGPMATALSHDGGKTWLPGPNPADDQSSAGHGFIDIAADPAGTFHLTWLDSRDGRQGLRYARSRDGGHAWSANATVRADTCECCWNTLKTGPGGEVGIVFRDKDPRDMALAFSPDGGQSWEPPRLLGGFGWKFDGCPHTGGGLVLGTARKPIHALIWNGSAGNAGVFHVRSAGPDMAWTAPLSLGDASASHPDLAGDPSGRLVAAWDASADGTTGIHAAISSDHGATWSDARRLSSQGRTATHPRVSMAGRGFRVFWTEAGADGPTVWRSAMIMPGSP